MNHITPYALCARCGCPRRKFRHLTLAYWGKPYCTLCCGHVAADHDRHGTWPPRPEET